MNRITELRKNKKISQKELGELLGVAQNTVCNWENGRREPEYEMLLKLANFFGVSTDYLLGNSDSESSPCDISSDSAADSEKARLLEQFSRLSESEMQEALDYIRFQLSRREKKD